MTKTKKPSKRRAIRLLPLTMTMLSLVLVVKMNELYIGSKTLREVYAARDAVAEDAKDVKKPDEKAASPTPAQAAEMAVKPDAEVKPAEAAAAPDGEKKADGSSDAKVEKEAAPGDKKEEKTEGEHGSADEKSAEEPRTHGTGKSTVKAIEEMKAKEATPRYTQTELDLLQNLSKRRDELDRREKELDIKSKVLEATDKRIADKMNEMKTLQSELSAVLSQYNEKQDAQIKSLVKIYESMKPDEAAAIFNEMDMPILLEVIAKMSERKVAPVLANMSPKKARDVTQELAEKRKKAIPAAAATTKP